MSQDRNRHVREKPYQTEVATLGEVPRGNTAAGVNKTILEYLHKNLTRNQWTSVLDLPCGNGMFLSAVRKHFDMKVKGGDIREKPALLSPDEYIVIDAASPFPALPDEKFDVITCISGIGEFGNTSQFFDFCRTRLNDGGALFVSNDNVATIQDRLLYLVLGRTRRMKLFRIYRQSLWNLIPIGILIRFLHDAGFAIEDIRYLVNKKKDYWMLPLALLVFPIQYLYVYFAYFFEKVRAPYDLRRKMYPFRSLYSAHYVVIARRA